MPSRHLACSLGRGTDFADSVCKILKAGNAKKNARVCVRCATQSPAKTWHQISGELLNKDFFVFRVPPLVLRSPRYVSDFPIVTNFALFGW
jgi:hypothetical protein